MKVVLLSVSRILDDPRVRRHGDALAEAGFLVAAAGLPGGRSPPPVWPVAFMDVTPASHIYLASRVLKVAGCRVWPGLAETAFWGSRVSVALYNAGRSLGPANVWLANDWTALPVAARLAAETGGRYVYDSHEYAIEEGSHRLGWRLLFPPYVHAVQSRYIPAAAAVITVAEGIAKLIRRDYNLAETPTVVRNLALRQAHPPRPTGDRITVLYHGAFRGDRGLETLLESVPLWQPHFRLVLRGFGESAYTEQLASLASRAGGRIAIEEPCSPGELVRLANQADIGIHPIPPSNAQSRFCLPNKLFEYVQAGLAVCVGGAVEMARLIDRYQFGLVFPSHTPEAIAATINSLNPQTVDRFKANAAAAARLLCWEQEQAVLTDLLRRLAE